MKRWIETLAAAAAVSGLVFGCAGDADSGARPGTGTQEVTYFQDMVPLFERHCLSCHREGGIGAFRLDDYAQAKARGALIRQRTGDRSMPPWGVTSDGSCGDFRGSLALADQEIQRISDWVDGGAKEGTMEPISVPALPGLEDATELKTPIFTPEIDGGPLAESDEYRCFVVDFEQSQTSFITGYEVLPGNSAMIHHVLVMLVDPEAAAEVDEPGVTNLQRMQALDDESPDREGWPCFGMAGEGVNVDAVPVTWAPGQGVVEYPNSSGVPLSATHKIVVQVHYNLVEPSLRGTSDQTRIRLRLASEVENVGLFALEDPFLDTLFGSQPDVLAPARRSTTYTWRETLSQMGLGALPQIELHGIMPHMHQLGRKYRFSVNVDGVEECAADVQNWDFHWQRMYFYRTPLVLNRRSTLQVTCDYDTSGRVEPVLPGWGTSNEMCLATLYFTVPLAMFQVP